MLRAGFRALAEKTTDSTRKKVGILVSTCQRTTCVREHWRDFWHHRSAR